jgi:hypothetical protein
MNAKNLPLKVFSEKEVFGLAHHKNYVLLFQSGSDDNQVGTQTRPQKDGLAHYENYVLLFQSRFGDNGVGSLATPLKDHKPKPRGDQSCESNSCVCDGGNGIGEGRIATSSFSIQA